MRGAKDREQGRATSWPARDDMALGRILKALHAKFGVDFGEYKRATLERRVAARMVFAGTAALRDYVTLVLGDPHESRALYEDILVNVTSFFRDPGVFATLARDTVPAILRDKRADSPIRVWVAGCATGEEVYSLAILLLELVGDGPPDVQVIGTDVSHAVVATARAGEYSDAALAGMSEDRRAKYFVQTAAGHRINDAVRDRCSFFQHDVAQDPPLAHIDLVSCRNVLMYFQPRVQLRLLALLHRALEPRGVLMLGRAEGIAGSDHLFSLLDFTSRLFARRATVNPDPDAVSPEPRSLQEPAVRADPSEEIERPPVPPGLGRYFDRTLLARYVPAAVLINADMQIFEFRGPTGVYLELAPGRPSHEITAMLRPGLRGPLLVALELAKTRNGPARMRGVRFQRDRERAVCDLVVVPLAQVPTTTDRLFAVMFEPRTARADPRRLAPPAYSSNA